MYADGKYNADAQGRVNAQADAPVARVYARPSGAIRYIIICDALSCFCACIRRTT